MHLVFCPVSLTVSFTHRVLLTHVLKYAVFTCHLRYIKEGLREYENVSKRHGTTLGCMVKYECIPTPLYLDRIAGPGTLLNYVPWSAGRIIGRELYFVSKTATCPVYDRIC